MEKAEQTIQIDVTLLHRIDGMLGLARHRGVNEQWEKDADSLISEIRKVINEGV